MTDLDAYLRLMENHPALFENPNTPGILEILSEPNLLTKHQMAIGRRNQELRQPPYWSSLGVAAEDPWVLVLRDLVRFPNGKVGPYTRIVNKKSLLGGTNVAILPVMNDKILLIEIFRHALRRVELEIPRGFGEDNLSREESVRSEVREEIGLEPRTIHHLGTVTPNSGLLTEQVELFLAKLNDGQIAPSSTEGISKVRMMDVVEFEELLLKGGVRDSFTLAAYALARIKGLL